MLPDDRSTRRSFLAPGSTATLLTLCGGCSLFLDIRAPDVKARAVDGKVRIPLEEHPAITETGGTLALEVEGMSDKILLFRRPNGQVLAVSMTCTHRGCDVNYEDDNDRIECPCHGSLYDTNGSNLRGPADEPLKQFPVETAGNQLVVRVG